MAHDVEQPIGKGAFHRLGFFKVQPHHLLMPADDAQFGGGRPVGMNQSLVVNAARSELIEQALAVKIVTDKAGNRGLTAEPGKIMRDVGRAAQRFF